MSFLDDFIWRAVIAGAGVALVAGPLGCFVVWRRMAYFTLEKYMPVYGSEPIMREGRILNVTTSANFGYTIGKPLVFGYLPIQEFENRNFTVEAFGEVVPATRHDGPLYDPEMKKLKL